MAKKGKRFISLTEQYDRDKAYSYAEAVKLVKSMATAKEAAREVLERLSDQVTWNDIMYELYVKQKLETGLADIEAGRTVPHQQLKAEILGHDN